MPLYPDERQIGLAVLGPKRAKEWPRLALYLEQKHALPPIDELMGGRYWPAVMRFFELYNGIANPDNLTRTAAGISDRIRMVPPKPDGRENFEVAPKPPRKPLVKP